MSVVLVFTLLIVRTSKCTSFPPLKLMLVVDFSGYKARQNQKKAKHKSINASSCNAPMPEALNGAFAFYRTRFEGLVLAWARCSFLPRHYTTLDDSCALLLRAFSWCRNINISPPSPLPGPLYFARSCKHCVNTLLFHPARSPSVGLHR